MIIDGNALLHRAWHALPQTMKAPDGRITNAAYGFALILFKAIKDIHPEYLAVCFDAKGETFRDQMYAAYKAGRPVKPQELYDQIPMVQKILTALNIKYYQISGVEADDVIGTLAQEARNKKQETKTIIVTGDLDTLQLVDEQTEVYTLKKGVTEILIYDTEEVKKRYDGLEPHQLLDYKALRGDPSDNIPGARGILSEGAIQLIKKLQTVEKIYAELAEKSIEQLAKSSGLRESVFEKLLASKKEVELSKKLSAIKQDVNIKFDFKETLFGFFDPTVVVKVLQGLAFRSLATEVQRLAGEYEVKLKTKNEKPSTRAQAEGSKIKEDYLIGEDQIAHFLVELGRQKEFAVDTETDSLDTISARLVGLSFCWGQSAHYLEYKRLQPKADQPLAEKPEFLLQLKSILENREIKKIGHNLKFDWQVLKNVDINLQGIYFDTMVAAYLINPGQRIYSLDALAFAQFGVEMQRIEELIGPRGKQGQLNMGQVDSFKVAKYAAEDALYTWRLYQKFAPEIKIKNLEKVFFEIEMPLIKILGEMERVGIKLDSGVLKHLDKKVSLDIKKLEIKIHKLAGCDFNIASPQQLKEILFERLGLGTKGIKKNKTGISTAAPELEKLREAHPIVKYIFEYRELAKLKSTYIDSLPVLVNPKTGRVHTSFNQTITTTGRLSSSTPNMQNIPIRTALGREIRRAFVAADGYQLLSLDYSQIDLRMAAHLSDDAEMIATFKADFDIHSATAARLFNVKIDEVTPAQRRKAKEANFGVLYGLGPRGLAQRMGVSFAEAEDFIARYQALYPRVFAYLDGVIAETRERGFAETLFGRRRYLPEINSGSPMMRAAAERAAINMPTQGTAADVIKIAMVKIDSVRNVTEIRMLLQVHDELVFEVKKDKVKYWALVIKNEMESAAKLKVPLKVEAKVGDNWKEMKPA